MKIAGVAPPLGAAALAVALLAACGSGSEPITAAGAETLHEQVDAVRAAVADGRIGAARKAVTELRTAIRRLAEDGELDPADSLVLLTQVDRITERIDARATPTPTPAPTPAPTLADPVAPKGKDKPGKAKKPAKPKGPGKGKGNG